jgi:Protein of unknown function (DUF2917)
MTTTLTHLPQQISLDTAVTLRLYRAGWLRSPHGRAWLTRTHGGGDIILAPGAWQWVEPGTHWVVEPLHPRRVGDEPLRLEWQPLPSRWAALRLVVRHVVDRLRGEAEWGDAVRPTRGAPRVHGPRPRWTGPRAV